jgi:hypothetical protein
MEERVITPLPHLPLNKDIMVWVNKVVFDSKKSCRRCIMLSLGVEFRSKTVEGSWLNVVKYEMLTGLK